MPTRRRSSSIIKIGISVGINNGCSMGRFLFPGLNWLQRRCAPTTPETDAVSAKWRKGTMLRAICEALHWLHHAVVLLDLLAQFYALFGCEHIGGILDCHHDTFGGGIELADLSGAQLFQRRAINSRLF